MKFMYVFLFALSVVAVGGEECFAASSKPGGADTQHVGVRAKVWSWISAVGTGIKNSVIWCKDAFIDCKDWVMGKGMGLGEDPGFEEKEVYMPREKNKALSDVK